LGFNENEIEDEEQKNGGPIEKDLIYYLLVFAKKR